MLQHFYAVGNANKKMHVYTCISATGRGHHNDACLIRCLVTYLVDEILDQRIEHAKTITTASTDKMFGKILDKIFKSDK